MTAFSMMNHKLTQLMGRREQNEMNQLFALVEGQVIFKALVCLIYF